MKPILNYLAGYLCTTLQFNAFRFAEIKKPNHVCAWYPGRAPRPCLELTSNPWLIRMNRAQGPKILG